MNYYQSRTSEMNIGLLAVQYTDAITVRSSISWPARLTKPRDNRGQRWVVVIHTRPEKKSCKTVAAEGA